MTMIKRNWGIIRILLIAVWLVVSCTPAGAETVKYKVTTQITKWELVPVPDVEGHAVGVFERRGVCIFENEVGTVLVVGTLDMIKKEEVSFQGYSETTWEDGSTTIHKYKGTLTSALGEKLRSYKVEGEYIKGTGRFEGIKGKISFTGREITPYTKDETKGDAIMDVTATYTLPSK